MTIENTAASAARLVFRDDVLAGRTALITGGSSGIGLGIAEVYGLLGANLVLVGRDADKLDAARQALVSTGAQILTLSSDVRDYTAAQEIVPQNDVSVEQHDQSAVPRRRQ